MTRLALPLALRPLSRQHATQPHILSSLIVPAPAQLLSHALAAAPSTSEPPARVPHPRLHALKNNEPVPAGWEQLYFLTPGAKDAYGTDAAGDWNTGRTFWNPLMGFKFGSDARCFVRNVDGGIEREIGAREGWSVRDRREWKDEAEAAKLPTGKPAFERSVEITNKLCWQFSALTYDDDSRYFAPLASGHRLVHPDLQRLILLDLIHQFRPDLSISSFSYSVGDPLVSSKTTRFLAFPCESDREDGFRLMAVQGDSIIGMNGDLVCVKKEAARTAKGESKSGLARMVRWE